MRKNNWVVLVVLLIVSVFLLWLWFFKGFNVVDNPLDVAISVIWWILLVVLLVVMKVTEDKRRAAVRTTYIGANGVFNSETGLITTHTLAEKMTAVTDILEGLQYGFSAKDLPEKQQFEVNFIVHSKKFADGGNTWEGHVEVMNAGVSRAQKFSNKEQLAAIIK